jgi:hypothetical protein
MKAIPTGSTDPALKDNFMPISLIECLPISVENRQRLSQRNCIKPDAGPIEPFTIGGRLSVSRESPSSTPEDVPVYNYPASQVW